MLKLLDYKFLYLCYSINVRPSMDTQASGSSTTPALNLSSKIKAAFFDVFTTKLPTGLPPCRNVEHRIELVPGANPVTQPSYRMSIKEETEVRKVIDEYLSKGLIRPSFSPFASPILLVKKKDGSFCMCVDYRALNKITVKHRYPMPRIDDLLDALGGATVFSKIDLKSGYHQIRVRDEDVHKTAFRTRFGQYEYLVMPFGLTNAPATFMMLMNDILRPFMGQFVVDFIDDVLVYSKNLIDHEVYLHSIFQALREHGLLANSDKTFLFLAEIEYLGYIVSADGIRMDPKKVAVILAWPMPQNVSQLRSFLGLSSFYRKFIEYYSFIVAPMIDLLQEQVLYIWTPVQQDSFDSLKQAVSTAPVLKIVDPEKPFDLETDASGVAIGAVLTQEGRPTAFESKKLSPA